MANNAAKKRKFENEAILLRLWKILLIVNAIYILVRMVFFWSSFGTWHWIGFVGTTAVYWFCYSSLSSMAKPTFDEQGKLLDGGGNLSGGGLVEYYFDVIYVSAFVQLSSILTDWMWLSYLVIPIYAVYALWGLVIKPLLQARSAAAEVNKEESKADQKRREKKERKENRSGRVKYKTMRK